MDINDYISRIVEPTFLDFQRNPRSGRHAFLACVVVYHSVDYASYPNGTKSITEEWQKESIEFAIVDIVANHLKHVKSKIQKIYEAGGIKDKIPLHKAILKDDESKEDDVPPENVPILK